MSSGESPTPTGSTPEMADAPAEIDPGTVVASRYRVVSLLGEGAMGAVYHVEEVGSGKPSALKVLHASMSDQRDAVARFEREAIAAGKIAHRNVAAATDFGRMPDGSFFLVLEFVAGRSLRSELDQGALEPRRAIRIMQGVVAGVAAAHAKGIVHRDLKPENIMLVKQDGDPDFVKVLDFGIAKVSDVRSAGHGNVARTLTKAGTVIGTPDYMSPEQALGRAVDERSDLYSLGVVLYELLTGSAPFRGGAATLLRQQVMDAPKPLPRRVIEDGDPQLAEMLHKLLAKKPEDRFQTAEELMAVLDAVAGKLAAKGVLGDFGLRGRRGGGADGMLQRLMRHLPRSSVGRLTGLHVAIAIGVFFASTVTVLFLILRNAPDRGETDRAAPDRGTPDRGATDRVTTDSPPASTTSTSPPAAPPTAAPPTNPTTAAPPTRAAPARAPATSTPSRSAPKATGSRK